MRLLIQTMSIYLSIQSKIYTLPLTVNSEMYPVVSEPGHIFLMIFNSEYTFLISSMWNFTQNTCCLSRFQLCFMQGPSSPINIAFCLFFSSSKFAMHWNSDSILLLAYLPITCTKPLVIRFLDIYFIHWLVNPWYLECHQLLKTFS